MLILLTKNFLFVKENSTKPICEQDWKLYLVNDWNYKGDDNWKEWFTASNQFPWGRYTYSYLLGDTRHDQVGTLNYFRFPGHKRDLLTSAIATRNFKLHPNEPGKIVLRLVDKRVDWVFNYFTSSKLYFLQRK